MIYSVLHLTGNKLMEDRSGPRGAAPSAASGDVRGGGRSSWTVRGQMFRCSDDTRWMWGAFRDTRRRARKSRWHRKSTRALSPSQDLRPAIIIGFIGPGPGLLPGVRDMLAKCELN